MGADGRRRAGAFCGLVSRIGQCSGGIAREAAIRWHVPPEKDITTRWYVVGCWAWAGGSGSDAEGRSVNDVPAAAVSLPTNSKTCTYRFGVAAGEWEDPRRNRGPKLQFRRQAETRLCLHARLSERRRRDDHDLAQRRRKDLRIVAVDKQGKFLANGGAQRRRGRLGFVQSTGLFRGLKLADVGSYQLQARDFRWSVVRNVAINKDQHTEPQIIDAGRDAEDAVTRSVSATSPSPWERARVRVFAAAM